MSEPFALPPYPYDRVATLQRLADALPGGVVNMSIGEPVDPIPEIVLSALMVAAPSAVGYPATIGSIEFREAVSDWWLGTFGVTVSPEQTIACLGAKEFIASLPHFLHLRTPERDTVLVPAVAYPTYEMGARLAGLRAVPVPLDADWNLDLDRVAASDAQRALLLWLNTPANPTGATMTAKQVDATVAWARARGIVCASDEVYAPFTYDDAGDPAPPVTALAGGADGVLALQSLSKRSNMAGLRAGFVSGDPELITYLGEIRKHAGLMTPSPVQAAATAALHDDDHVAVQRARYAERRSLLLPALEDIGLIHDGGPSTFFLWLRDIEGADDGWELAARLAEAGILGLPGDLYGAAGADHVRLSLAVTDERLDVAITRLQSVNERR